VEVLLEADNLMMREDGMLCDFAVLGEAVKKHIIEPMDHAFIGRKSDLPHSEQPSKFFDMGSDYSTAENIARQVFLILKRKNVPFLKEVTIWETPTNSASYTG